MALLRGVALLSRGEVLATLPSEEALPLTDRQAERERESRNGERAWSSCWGVDVFLACILKHAVL